MPGLLISLWMTTGMGEEILYQVCCIPIPKDFHQVLRHLLIMYTAKDLSWVSTQMLERRPVVKCRVAMVMKKKMQNSLQSGGSTFLNMIIVFVPIMYHGTMIIKWQLKGTRQWVMR